MKTITVNSISTIYEKLYKTFTENTSPEESFYAVNNAMIFAYFVNFIDIPYFKDNQQECYNRIVEKYGMDIFFHNIKKTEKYRANRDVAIESFVSIFKDQTVDNMPLEKLLGNVLEKHINRKDTGSYYTPSDTTRYISEKAIVVSLLNKCENKVRKQICKKLGINDVSDIFNMDSVIQRISTAQLSLKEKNELLNTLYSMKIIDPTCGSGAFIVAAFECLEEISFNIGAAVDYNKIIDCLYGLDLSREAVQLTKLRMLMRIVNKHCDLDYFNNSFERNFKVGDAVKGSDYVIDEEGFDWKEFGCQFDCIIGNPPYVEAGGYVSDNFLTRKCGNLYAYVIERACNIAQTNAIISFIVPLPFVSTPRMQSAKKYLEDNSKNIFYGTFADRPGCIFTGVHQRLTIFFAELGDSKKCNIYSSSYNYWYNDERNNLFKNIRYLPNEFEGILPKIGNEIERSLYKKFTSKSNSIFDLLMEKSDYPLYLSTRIGFWTKAFDKNVFSSNEYKELFANNKDDLYLALAILNSSSFYYFWVITSDCWHITNKNLEDFRFDKSEIEKLPMKKIKNLVDELLIDLEKNKKYIGSKQTAYEYKHKYSKPIIDQIDDVLSPLFDLNIDELNYIKSYTEKYRLNTMEV